MLKFNIDDYISVTDSESREVLHIEIDSDIEEIADRIEKFVDEINKKFNERKGE